MAQDDLSIHISWPRAALLDKEGNARSASATNRSGKPVETSAADRATAHGKMERGLDF